MRNQPSEQERPEVEENSPASVVGGLPPVVPGGCRRDWRGRTRWWFERGRLSCAAGGQFVFIRSARSGRAYRADHSRPDDERADDAPSAA